MTPKEQRDDHNTVRLPEDLTDEMDKLIGKHGFRSRAEIAKQAIRGLLREYQTQEPAAALPRLEHFNIDDDGVRILDRSLATSASPKGRIIDVFFKPEGIFCDYDQASCCAHIDFALRISAVQKIVKKKGWKIDLPDET